MEEVRALYERIADGDKVDLIRLDIADLIAKCLAEKRETLGYWEKGQFAYAIAALARNTYSGNRESAVWLRLCLVCIEKAYVPPDKRADDPEERNEHIDALTYEQLAVEVRTLGGHT